ncbi:MAG: YfcC family protein, partial [Synergistaceae bacterium]|nr:YfcC family protein [Synergistaceae bacterium]
MAEQAAKKTFKVPHTFVILFFLIVVATIGTYIIPAGVYDRVTDPITNRSVVDPLSYHLVEATPV